MKKMNLIMMKIGEETIINKIKDEQRLFILFFFVASGGFEPPLLASKAYVLPLHQEAIKSISVL